MREAQYSRAEPTRGARALAALPFYIAFLIPGSAALALGLRGLWSWSTVILIFGITPVLDALVGRDLSNPGPESSSERAPEPARAEPAR